MTDLDIIKQIEKELNVELKKLDETREIRGISHSYILNQNKQVVGLNLHRCNIQNLNRIISPLKDLKNLTVLELGSSELSDISPLRNLKKLTRLNLHTNPIEELLLWITDFNMEIKK